MREKDLRLAPAGLTEDRQGAVLNLCESQQVVQSLTLEAPELDDLILNLARARASLQDAVPMMLDPTFRVATVIGSPWAVTVADHDSPGVLLVLRHPGLGWLGFVLATSQVEAMADALRRTMTAIKER